MKRTKQAPSKPKIENLFCPTCGRQLVDEFFKAGYEMSSGKQLYVVYSTCPNHKPFHFWDGHFVGFRSAHYESSSIRRLYYEDGTEVY